MWTHVRRQRQRLRASIDAYRDPERSAREVQHAVDAARRAVAAAQHGADAAHADADAARLDANAARREADHARADADAARGDADRARRDARRLLIEVGYEQFLSRRAHPDELSNWDAELDGGMPPSSFLHQVATSAEATAVTRGRDEHDRVRARTVWLGFDVALRRAPSDAELTHWLDRFDAGWSPWDLVAALTTGSAVRAVGDARDESRRALIEAAYARYLSRPASADEIAFWMPGVDGEAAWTFLEAIRAAAATEAERRVADDPVEQLSNAAFAAAVFEPLSGRPLHTAEVIDWKRALDRDPSDRSTFLVRTMTDHIRRRIRGPAESAADPARDPRAAQIAGTDEMLTPERWSARLDAVRQAAPEAPPTGEIYPPYVAKGRVLTSAITSLYRGGQHIEHFLEMMTAQTMGTDFELIIIDAHSPEDERLVIERVRAAHPNIVYRRLDRRAGIYTAWNIGVELARGDYLTNANVDDLREPTSLERQTAVLETMPWVDVVYQDFLYTLDSSLDFDTVARAGFTSDLPIITPANLLRLNSPHHAPMWRKALHDDVGLFDEFLRSAGDYDFWLRCAARGKQFFKLEHPHTAYFQNPAGMSTRLDTPGIEEAQRVLRAHIPALVSPTIFADDAQVHARLESLAGASIARSPSDSFADLAVRALEACWWSVGRAPGDDSA